MVRVDAPPVTVTPSPSRDRVAPWLAVAAVAMLIGAFLPWERWCGAGSFEDVERCFSARLWSGSASLLGGLAIGRLVVFLISTARLGFRAPVGIGRLSLYAGMLTAITAKLLIVAENDLITSESDSAGGPAWVGAWIGAFLAVMGIWLLATTAWKTKPRLRSIAVPVAVILAVTAGGDPVRTVGPGLVGWGAR